MIKPGIFECAVNELQPALRKLLQPHFEPEDAVLLCLTKFWDGELSAFVITGRKAMLVSWDTAILSTSESQNVREVPFNQVASVQESQLETQLLTLEYRIELWSQDQSATPVLAFAFLHHDALYQKFCDLIQQQVARSRRVISAGPV